MILYLYDKQRGPGNTPFASFSSRCYSKDPKSVTTFIEFTFFRADIIQLEVSDSLQLDSDWIKSARKNVNKFKAVTLLSSLL